ncbi:MAG TPA: SAM-dependent methyltransferase [Kofleriaceae bacterium]|nr:SAM-dependent methyltransferase [Kofleriaceae bacterium]
MNRVGDAYFAEIYAREPDPWGFASRWYETRKYALTVAALPRQRYARAFEPGCSIGVLTERLAERCDALVATDLIAAVVDRARERVRRFRHVDVRIGAIPDDWPEGRFDLVVLSEVAYYLTATGFAQLLGKLDASLVPGGHVVAVHWTGPTDYPQTASRVHDCLDNHASWSRHATYAEPSFVLSVYERSKP